MTPRPSNSDYSLQTRLLMALSILLFAFLGLTGIILDRAFNNSIEAGAGERLQVQIYLLLSTVEHADAEFYLLEELPEPRFNQLDSGLYGFISNTGTGELWRSASARAFMAPVAESLRRRLDVGDTRFERLQFDGDDYFALSYGILWDDGISEYNFSVVENAAPYYSEVSNFRTSLWFWLGGVAVLLLLIQFHLMRWGLAPLSNMAAELKNIESGIKDRLEGRYPRELRGLADNLNHLIETERKRRQRYRTTLDDLTHSLKTPLAVIAGILPRLFSQPTEDAKRQVEMAGEQLDRMNQIVSYQLQRAVQSNSSSSLASRVNVAQDVRKVLEVLAKVYADRPIELDTDLDDRAIFHGDGRDLTEVLGNVLDNAFKYGQRRIRVAVVATPPSASGFRIRVEDDGPGIPADKREFVLQRGARADTLLQGQGIGLAVVTDIVNSYGGDIQVQTSELGGASILINFDFG